LNLVIDLPRGRPCGGGDIHRTNLNNDTPSAHQISAEKNFAEQPKTILLTNAVQQW
jgi:hypothetical protein